MEASPSSSAKGSKGKNKKFSITNPFYGPFVCRWWGSLFICFSYYPSYSSFFILTFIYLPCFTPFLVVSSHPQALATPPTTTLYSTTTDITLKHSHNNPFLTHKVVVIVVATVLCFVLLVFLSLMALFKCLGFKLKRTRTRVPDDHSKVSVVEVKNELSLKKRFTFDEVEKYTMNMSRSRLIAYGGFSTVYLAQFPGSMFAAVKIIDLSSERLQRVYNQELEILLQIQHDYIVKFLGYCDNGESGMLMFEYVPNGTLQEKLHSMDAKKITWKNRMVIAFQLAQAIEYLHDKCSLPIVHGDIKSSNVLLDKKFNCKLCDFGSAKMGFSSTVLHNNSHQRGMMLGSPGYTDPHYLRTGIASKKNDIYSFGVIVLELVSGFEALSCDNGERLISKAGTMLRDSSKVASMVDPKLNGSFDLEEAKAMVSLAGSCLGDSPSLRPSASEILQTMTTSISSISFLFSLDKTI